MFGEHPHTTHSMTREAAAGHGAGVPFVSLPGDWTVVAGKEI